MTYKCSNIECSNPVPIVVIDSEQEIMKSRHVEFHEETIINKLSSENNITHRIALICSTLISFPLANINSVAYVSLHHDVQNIN